MLGKNQPLSFEDRESCVANLLEFFEGVIAHKTKSHQLATGYCSLHKAFDKAFIKNSEENLSWHGIKVKFIESINNSLKEWN